MVLLMVVVMTDVDMVHGVKMGVLFSSLYFLELIDQDQNKNKCPQCAAPSKNNKSRKEKKSKCSLLWYTGGYCVVVKVFMVKGGVGGGWKWWRVEVVEGGGLCALCCLVFRLMVFFFSRGRGCTLRVGVNESGKEA